MHGLEEILRQNEKMIKRSHQKKKIRYMVTKTPLILSFLLKPLVERIAYPPQKFSFVFKLENLIGNDLYYKNPLEVIFTIKIIKTMLFTIKMHWK